MSTSTEFTHEVQACATVPACATAFVPATKMRGIRVERSSKAQALRAPFPGCQPAGRAALARDALGRDPLIGAWRPIQQARLAA